MKIRIADIIDESIVDGPGLRLTVFTQGCVHNCFGCHNPQTHPLDGGKEIEIDDIINRVKKNPLLSGITISGGEPLLQKEATLELTRKVQQLGLDVIIYTGYTYEALYEADNISQTILQTANYLIDGKFEMNKRSLSLVYRGSTNQRIIDLKKTTRENIVVTDFTDY